MHVWVFLTLFSFNNILSEVCKCWRKYSLITSRLLNTSIKKPTEHFDLAPVMYTKLYGKYIYESLRNFNSWKVQLYSASMWEEFLCTKSVGKTAWFISVMTSIQSYMLLQHLNVCTNYTSQTNRAFSNIKTTKHVWLKSTIMLHSII